jgi:glutamyl-tRNA synthetase
MRQYPVKKKVPQMLAYLQRAGVVADPPPCHMGPTLTRVIEAAGDRLKTMGDILDCREFFVADIALTYDEAAFEKRLRAPGAKQRVERFRQLLAAIEPFDAPTLDAQFHAFVAEQGIKVGDVIHAIRVAVTGKPVGLGLFDTLAILGRASCLARLDRALQRI